MTNLPMTARGLLELRVAEHLQEVEVKKQDLFSAAKGAVYRVGTFQVAEDEVTINADGI
jgi:hypothetical protein